MKSKREEREEGQHQVSRSPTPRIQCQSGRRWLGQSRGLRSGAPVRRAGQYSSNVVASTGIRYGVCSDRGREQRYRGHTEVPGTHRAQLQNKRSTATMNYPQRSGLHMTCRGNTVSSNQGWTRNRVCRGRCSSIRKDRDRHLRRIVR